jgi:hypothetical protein
MVGTHKSQNCVDAKSSYGYKDPHTSPQILLLMYEKVMSWSIEEAQVFIAKSRDGVKECKVHAYLEVVEYLLENLLPETCSTDNVPKCIYRHRCYAIMIITIRLNR